MKIIYIITLPDLGGAQVHLYELVSKLSSDTTPYIVIGQEGWLSQQLKNSGVKVYVVKTLVRQISLYNDIRAVFAVKKIINAIQPDIIHCHSSKAGVIGRIAAKISGVPAIFTAHGWAFTEGVSAKKQWIYKHIERRMAKWSEKIFCVSEYDRQLALKVMPEYESKIITIHNGVSRIEIPRKKIDKEALRIVMIARFSPQKDQLLLIEAVNELIFESNMNITLTLVGDGPNYDKVRAYAENKRCKQQVNFLGSRTDIVDILASNDLFALISNWEGFPISILEAMRQGMPVLSSDVGGVKEAVADGETGFLIPRADKECIKEKIRTFYENRNLIREMGEISRCRFLQLFSSEIMMSKITNVYNEVSKEKMIL